MKGVFEHADGTTWVWRTTELLPATAGRLPETTWWRVEFTPPGPGMPPVLWGRVPNTGEPTVEQLRAALAQALARDTLGGAETASPEVP